MAELFTNNASSTLAAGITAAATSATLQTGEGAKFPSPTGSDFFRVVLFKKSTGEWEIAACTGRSGDILTLSRAYEDAVSHPALALNADDVVELRPTAGFFTSLAVTSTNIQDNSFKYDTETGAADAYVITPTPAITAYGVGQEFWFKPTNNNTGPCTLSVSGVASPPSIKLIDGSDPYADALVVGKMAHVINDGTNYVLQNPQAQAELTYFEDRKAHLSDYIHIEDDFFSLKNIVSEISGSPNDEIAIVSVLPGSVIMSGALKLAADLVNPTTYANASILNQYHPTSGALRYKTRIYTDSSLSDATDSYEINIGLASSAFTGVSFGIFEGAWFHYTHSDSAGNIECKTKKSSVGTTTTDSGVAFAVDSFFDLEIVINASWTSVAFYINGSLVATHATNIPSNYIIPNFHISSNTTTSGVRLFYSDYLIVTQTLSAAR